MQVNEVGVFYFRQTADVLAGLGNGNAKEPFLAKMVGEENQAQVEEKTKSRTGISPKSGLMLVFGVCQQAHRKFSLSLSLSLCNK